MALIILFWHFWLNHLSLTTFINWFRLFDFSQIERRFIFRNSSFRWRYRQSNTLSVKFLFIFNLLAFSHWLFKILLNSMRFNHKASIMFCYAVFLHIVNNFLITSNMDWVYAYLLCCLERTWLQIIHNLFHFFHLGPIS